MGISSKWLLNGKTGLNGHHDAPTSTSGCSSTDTILASDPSPNHACHGVPAQHSSRRNRSASSMHSCPPHGAKAICGARPRMEDAYTAVPFLLELPRQQLIQELVPPRISSHVRSASGSLPEAGTKRHADADYSRPTTMPAFLGVTARGGTLTHSTAPQPVTDALHFFGVFDGHGGAEAALHCARTLHERLSEALTSAQRSVQQLRTGTTAAADQRSASVRSTSSRADSANTLGSTSMGSISSNEVGNQAAAPALEARDTHSHGRRGGGAGSNSSSSDMDALEAAHPEAPPAGPFSVATFESAFTAAFIRVDEELGKATDAAQVGTTAVVALVGDRQLYIGNCGDCRAVLCRGGVAIPLTDDHKAAREDETARVESLGGEIMYWNGERVMGVLAVSRAIGDHNLRPFVIAKPEVTIIGRCEEDEVLLLASDGLWDVLTNQEAVNLAQRCLRRARQRGASRQAATRVAASVLTRAAIDQGSSDNVTVVVVDLSRNTQAVDIKLGLDKTSPTAGLSRSQELQAQHTAG